MPDDTVNDPEATPAFEALASGYDARAGLPPGAGAAIAKAIVRLGKVGAEDLVLELGAGTGEIGAHLAALVPGYVGLDNSPAMLDVFRTKAEPAAPTLQVADGDEPWPLPAASTRVIFASRVIHLLDSDHVAREATRVSRPGGLVMLGRVRREADSLKERLRQRRQDLLRASGIGPRQGEPGSRHVIERLIEHGWTNLGRQSVATWTGETSAADILGTWETLSRMGSVEMEANARDRILVEMQHWAANEFGDLERRWPYREHYVLDVAQLS